MGPKDTFVRGHIKGTQAVGVLDTRLSKHSMLADVIGRHGAGSGTVIDHYRRSVVPIASLYG